MHLFCYGVFAKIFIFTVHNCIMYFRVELLANSFYRSNSYIRKALHKLLIHLIYAFSKGSFPFFFRKAAKSSFEVINDRKNLFNYSKRE